MTERLELKPGQRVLEIGTGSGYQDAVLAEMAVQIDTTEILEPLARQAEAVLKSTALSISTQKRVWLQRLASAGAH